ncbi:fimbrial protein [Citrobacter amalonaticus]|uniref:fimbrial protein n=1 Tax=Citrobacter amalonaticus TaxID=35703 RepID=UPI00255B1B29|nr:hypothetical protein [Citrobacter amalonaticus]MDL4618715.1 hypothetical protein [Citrobacter amalonaticus]MDL4622813.1 hypothetical protein [Citrobacter amalonaticus]
MSVYKLIIIIFCFHIFSVFAGTIDCEPATSAGSHNYDQWSTMHSAYELKPPGTNITLGSNIPDWTVIYKLEHVLVGVESGSCTLDVNIAYLYNSPYTTLLNTISGSKIYPTNVPGIGISIESYHGGGDGVKYPLGPYPDYNFISYSSTSDIWDTWAMADITFWKVPGNIPMSGGAITIDGPEIGIVYYGNTYTMTSKDPGRIVPFSGSSSGTGYLEGSRVLHATLIFQPGTCNVEGDNINVDMGSYDGTGGHSAWKDASFKLVCPDGYGYGGAYAGSQTHSQDDSPYAIDPNGTTTANNIGNGRVQISIVPYTETLDANRGIIGLDGTGAQGYGIQLAWGDYSTQNLAEPSKPVIVNSYVDAHSLNAAFSGGDTPIGGNGLVGLDNTIKMAARYIRTSGDTAPGPANAVVQVIANYQ